MSDQVPTNVEEKILNAASDLFSQLGFQAVGVDLIAKQSAVAKMTLYRRFKSKNELIALYLEEQDRKVSRWFESVLRPYYGDPQAQIVAVFDALQLKVSDEFFPGCPFQIAASEFPALDDPIHDIALTHKQSVLRRFSTLALEANAADPAALSNQLMLLYEGALSVSRMFGGASPAENLGDAARALVADTSAKKKKKKKKKK